MTEPEVTEHLEVGMIDRVVQFRGWKLEDDTEVVTVRNQSKYSELPEDLMAALEKHLGDALAKVTVGGELGHSKEYGCKAQAFVSISVHCNSDEKTIKEVKDILQEKVRLFVNEDLNEMIDDRNRFMLEDKLEKEPGRTARQAPPPNNPTKAAPRPGPRPRSFRR